MTSESGKDRLILKVLDGNATPGEVADLACWMKESPGNEAYFDVLKKAWNLTSGPRVSSEREDQELRVYLNYIRVRRNFHLARRVLKYAVLLLLPLCVGGYLFMEERVKEKMPPVLGKTEILPGEYKAVLTTGDGNTIPLSFSKQQDIHVHAHVTVTNTTLGIVYEDSMNVGSMGQFNALRTPRGGEYRLTLSDGTRVYLNAASELKYPVAFDREKREVYLSGEAYFEVNTDSTRPFYVVTEAVKIRVYGTSFNVNTYNPGATRAVLVSGRVGVQGVHAPGECRMQPGQLAEFDREGATRDVREVNTSVYTAWKDGRFVFEDESLEDILDVLSRWYDLDVFYMKDNMKKYHFTGHMQKYEHVEVILNAISKMVGVRFSIKERVVTVME